MLSLNHKLLALLDHVEIDNAFALAADFYNNEKLVAIEHQCIFENSWQLVGHISQLENTGDQLIAKIGRVPIVVVRNQNQQLKAFHNVCRHRAGPVATKNCNNKVLRCKYHGWTYNLDGQLKTAPEMQSTANFDVCQYQLPEARLEQWQGFIFVCISKTPPPFSDLINSISNTIKPIDISKMSFSHRDEFVIDCNWKVYMDNYLEGYHLPYVHPGLSKVLNYASYDTVLDQWYSYQFSPLENADSLYGLGTAHYYCIYPNLMLNILPGRLQTNIIIPENNKTRVIFDYYYSDFESEQTQKLVAQDKKFSDEVQQEDIDICERVQVGLNSGSYQAGPLCNKRETAVLHYQNLIRQSLRQAIEQQIIKVK